MTKIYTFTDDSWWDSGFGCDCCPSQLAECYNSGDVPSWLGSAGSIEEAMAQALLTEMGDPDEGDMDSCYNKTWKELEEELTQRKIRVIILGELCEEFGY